MLDSKSHSAQKRLLSNVYSKSFLQTSTDLQKISEHMILKRIHPIIRSVADKGIEMDVFDFSQAIGMDFTTAYLFGLSNGTDFMNDVELRHYWLKEYDTFRFRLPHERAGSEIERWSMRLCEAAENTLTHEKEVKNPPLSTEPVVYGRLSRGLAQGPQGKTDAQYVSRATASEMLDHIIAGHETTAITLTYLMHELSQHPELQARLRSELLTLEPPLCDSSNSLPSPRSIDALPLLDSVIQETLRLYAAAPAREPRLTPHVPGGTTIEGYPNIPGGVVISANAYTLHRNADVFPEPDKWVPERWLDERPGKKDGMKRWFWAFSSGGRMCIGSNFALQELKLVTAAIYTNFTTEIADDGGIEQLDDYVSRPAGGKLILRFKHVSDTTSSKWDSLWAVNRIYITCIAVSLLHPDV